MKTSILLIAARWTTYTLLGLVVLTFAHNHSSIDWGSIPNYAGFGTLIVAGFGLNTWRRQLRGTHDFELARRILLSVYEVRDGVRGVRNPFMDRSEGGEDDEKRSWQLRAYQARWDRVDEPRRRLRAAQLEAEVVWADGFDQPINDLNTHINRLAIATTHYLESLESVTKYTPKEDQSYTREDRHILYQIGDDAYEKDLVRLIDIIEKAVRPKMGKK